MVILNVGSVLYVSLSVFAAKLTTCQNLRKKIYVIFVFFFSYADFLCRGNITSV